VPAADLTNHNIVQNPNVALVIDDVLPPWQPRFVEIRGTAQPVPTGGKALFGASYEADDAIIRITPRQIIGLGLDEGTDWANNRKVERE
jgi:pyridoxamine 5'-phosphate oxidase family protein